MKHIIFTIAITAGVMGLASAGIVGGASAQDLVEYALILASKSKTTGPAVTLPARPKVGAATVTRPAVSAQKAQQSSARSGGSFNDARITELGFPKLDGSSKDAADLRARPR